MKTSPAASLGLALFLAACSTCDVTQFKVHENAVTGKLVFVSPAEQRDSGACYAESSGERLRSELDLQSGEIVHWVDARTEWTGGGRGYLDRAYDWSSGLDLQMGPAHRMVGDCSRLMGWGCDHKEQASAAVPAPLLEGKRQAGEGISVRFSRRGSLLGLTASFTAAQLKSHLDGIDARKSAMTGK